MSLPPPGRVLGTRSVEMLADPLLQTVQSAAAEAPPLLSKPLRLTGMPAGSPLVAVSNPGFNRRFMGSAQRLVAPSSSVPAARPIIVFRLTELPLPERPSGCQAMHS